MAPSTLIAHAAFFVDDAPSPDLGSLLDRGPLLALVVGTLAAIAVWAVASACADPRRERCAVRWASEHVSGVLGGLTPLVPVIARVALGAAMVWCAAIGSIATPNLQPSGEVADALRVVAALLGVALVVGVRARACAVGAIATFVTAAYAAGTPVVVLERLDVVGLAAFVAIVGGGRLEARMDAHTLHRLQFGTTWLRGMVAAGLLVVAITEKLANVPMTAAVLADHPHVDPGLLLGTDPATTVLLLGAVEVAFAVLVLLLPLPELLALAIGVPFVLSVGEFGLLEVPGHLPVWGAVLVLALLGAHVQTADLVTVRPPWMRSVRRTPDAARERLVGARVPWVVPVDAPGTAAATVAVAPPPRTIALTGSVTGQQRPVDLPSPPPIAPQVAAWLRAGPAAIPTASATGVAPRSAAASLEPPRFSWLPSTAAEVAVERVGPAGAPAR